MAIPDFLARKLDTLPDRPGVYLWKDAAGQIHQRGKIGSTRPELDSWIQANLP